MSSPLPPSDHPCWQRLVSRGASTLVTRQLSLQLLFKRLQGDNMAPAEKAREAFVFFKKYERILGSEIDQLHSR